MFIPRIRIGNLEASKFIIGGNPFSGFSHQGIDRDNEMIRYYTVARIKETLKQAEELGINTFLGRADQHIIRMLLEYRGEGGTIQWFAQTCPEMSSISRSVEDALKGGAAASYIHGGVMDFLLAANRLDEVPPAVEMIKNAGLPAGVAGHNPQVFEWAEENLDVDFYMCSYYNSAHRDEAAEHIHGRPEWFKSEDRDSMIKLIRRLSKPVIHYKIMAAGHNDPGESFDFTARNLRPQDALCVGVFTKDKPDMLDEDVRLFLHSVGKMVIIRAEETDDHEAVLDLHRSAFPTDTEARLVDSLRARGKALVSLVAELNGRIAGHVLFSPVSVEPPCCSVPGLGLAPVAVLPDCQRQGIGTALVLEGIEECRRAGFGFIIVLGYPGFYMRFGFHPASEAGLKNEYGVDKEFMVLELQPGCLEGSSGIARYSPEFQEFGE